MKIYKDGTEVLRVTTSSLSTSISAGAGSHKFTVSAWDSTGALYKSSVSVTVK